MKCSTSQTRIVFVTLVAVFSLLGAMSMTVIAQHPCMCDVPQGVKCGTGEDNGIAVSSLPMRGTTGLSAVYGNDNRLEYYEVAGSARGGRYLNSMNASVAIVRRSLLQGPDEPEQKVRLSGAVADLQFADSTKNLCCGERFCDQPAAAVCSGTLIREGQGQTPLVLTAAHCFYETSGDVAIPCSERKPPAPNAKDVLFVFGYRYKKAPEEKEVREFQDLRACKVRVQDGVPVLHRSGGGDWVLAELECAPSTPLPKAVPVVDPERTNVQVNKSVFALGYPSGLPLKMAADAKVLAVDLANQTFQATVDTFGGSSGGGIFLDDGSNPPQLVGILKCGKTDLRKVDVNDKACYRACIYPMNTKRGETITRITGTLYTKLRELNP